jgi:hypothetical protein
MRCPYAERAEPSAPSLPADVDSELAKPRAPNSLTAIANLKAFLSASPEFAADVEVVEALKDPLRGLEDGVLVTPTTVRLAPLPECRIIGSLRDQSALRLVFDPPASER